MASARLPPGLNPSPDMASARLPPGPKPPATALDLDPKMEQVWQIVEPTIARWLKTPIRLRAALHQSPNSRSGRDLKRIAQGLDDRDPWPIDRGGPDECLAALGDFVIGLAVADYSYNTRDLDAESMYKRERGAVKMRGSVIAYAHTHTLSLTHPLLSIPDKR